MKKIKQLMWTDTKLDSGKVLTTRSDSPIGTYIVTSADDVSHPNLYHIFLGYNMVGFSGGREHAKSYAQKHFEAVVANCYEEVEVEA